MSLTKIAIQPENGPQAITTFIGDTRYVVHCRWASRLASWYLDIDLASDGSPVHHGLRVAPGRRLLRQYRNRTADYPDGDLFVVNLDGTFDQPDHDDVGPTTLVLFIPSASEVEWFDGSIF